jgi:Tfp pilus assembly protein PilE
MRRQRADAPFPTVWSRRGLESGNSDESGFTLIELVIVTLVLPVVIGAISLALISIFSLQNGVSSRIGDSADAQTVSANFEQDIQSATMITTNQATTQCGAGTQLLGLEWNVNQQKNAYQTVVSYMVVPNSDGTTGSLVRRYCASGASSTPTASTTISFDVPAGLTSPTIGPSSVATSAAAGWVSTVGITSVTFSITEPGSKYSYTLSALPGTSSSSSQLSTLATPTTSCGFATPGTGTYASTLCFVDFTGFTASASGCQNVSAGIVNTPYIMTFCVSVSGGPVAGASIPTYFSPPTSEAFLGNNGFYTGIPGKPALYQTSEGTTTTVTITNIKVLDSNGNPATGWEFVSGDAESTDSGESITWTSNQNLSLLPDSTSSPIGNACAAPTKTNPSAVDFTGLGTQTVECAATVSSDKTGTVMLEAPAPTSLTVTMVGSGLQAIFIGMLLP